MISSDSPTLAPTLAATTFAELAQPGTEVVLGPCTDGSYYLIGMNELQPAHFTEIPWSTEYVLQETLAAAEQAGLRVATLDLWYDIDTVEDLRQVWADLERDTVLAPHKHRALRDSLFPAFSPVSPTIETIERNL